MYEELRKFSEKRSEDYWEGVNDVFKVLNLCKDRSYISSLALDNIRFIFETKKMLEGE